MTKTAQWDQLSDYLHRIERAGLKSLSHHELLEFGRLYRRAASDLSYAQAHGLDPEIKKYLNNLIGRAYGQLYHSDTRQSLFGSIGQFFREEFPTAVRKEWPFVVISVSVFFLASFMAFGLVRSDQAYAEALLPNGMFEMIERIVERHEVGGDWMPGIMRPLVSSAIMTNNIQVAFLAFSTGILAGLGSLYILFFNGLMLGAIAAGISQADLATASNFWGFVLPHGVVELPAIWLAGAAGLILGYALLNPGDYSRMTALKLAGHRALKIVLGVVAMLMIAGVIEAFFSPTLTTDLYKFIVAGLNFSMLILYLYVMPVPKHQQSS